MEPLRREVLCEMVGEAETLLVDSTLLSVLHPCSGFSGLGLLWGGVGKVGFLQRLRGEAAPHICATNGIRLSYELTPFRTSPADVSLAEELVAEAALGEG